MATTMEVILTTDASCTLYNIGVWDPQTGTSLMTYKGDSSGPKSLSFLRQDYLISAVNNKPLILLWALQRKDQSQLRVVCPGKVTALTASPDGAYCVAAVAEKLHVWQVSTGNLLAVLSRHYQAVTCLQFTDDGSHFVSAGEDNLAIVWSMSTILTESMKPQLIGASGIEPRYTWSKHSLPVTDLYIGHGGAMSRVATSSLDQTVKLWELCSGQLLCSLVYETSIVSIAMDSGECHMFAGGMNGQIYQCNLYEKPIKTERHVANSDVQDSLILKGHSKQVTCLAVSIDGTILVSGSHDCSVKLWDVPSRLCTRSIEHKGIITNVLIVPRPPAMFDPDSKPTLPIQQFQRQLHRPETGSHGDEHSRSDRGLVSIKTRKISDMEKISENIFRNVKTQSATNVLEEESPETQVDEKTEIKRLKCINKQIFDYAVNEILKHGDSVIELE